MPTALPRIQVTRTPEVEHALEIASAEWPDTPLSELLTRLAIEAAARRETDIVERREKRRRLLREMQGTIDYPEGYLEDLRKDWPE